MLKENWLERNMDQSEKGPGRMAIREMFKNVQEVKAPKKVIPISEVAEFADDARKKGVVATIVGQGQMASTEHMPIRTDNAATCNIFLIKTPQEGGRRKYTLVHVWSGELDSNLEGHKRKDIAALTNNQSTAIAITGGRSASYVSTAREFKCEGITTTKHIDVPTGNRYVSAVYRPDSNDILVRIGSDMDATEVWVYEGF